MARDGPARINSGTRPSEALEGEHPQALRSRHPGAAPRTCRSDWHLAGGDPSDIRVLEHSPDIERTIPGWARLPIMAFGQQSGPPASGSQVRELLALLKAAGHANFREARGPMGFTQRQAAGKFTPDEAAGFIDQLQDAEFNGDAAVVLPASTLSGTERLIRQMPDEQLAVELQRRGWSVTKP